MIINLHTIINYHLFIYLNKMINLSWISIFQIHLSLLDSPMITILFVENIWNHPGKKDIWWDKLFQRKLILGKISAERKFLGLNRMGAVSAQISLRQWPKAFTSLTSDIGLNLRQDWILRRQKIIRERCKIKSHFQSEFWIITIHGLSACYVGIIHI